ncbi:EAL domain-containing protein [Desulfosporosinus sp. BICA1-9]|uniref:EAL domain-containing protein n=1 Tax=Desulfosporosinus sp. BICA1-9 TaxID=1531958 RepID=UPI0005F257EF|nr:EAL domain-containing protein [Desulfosporosinus sp. BICA1-9]KJS85079.1 MAG: diguanylate cyclase [Desulfosporosinus sp. BICA1-9]HBW34106.1 GGDEF domain-containing protein [Desulfosporosinus sp.]
MNLEVLITNKELCVGCNKCIAKCPIKANVAFLYNGENRVKVDHLKCIHCGACIDVCDHHARDFADDTERFFSDLKRGHKISVIVAPSIRFNVPQYKRLFGYLKSLEVTRIYDVSLGADITTWAYLKAIEEQKLDSIIAQPCPVIVNYIQKYRPELIKNLAPIHSPMMCTAIYLRKYLNVHDQIAFLSPCIGKIDEISEKNADGLIEYNVTYKKIKNYLINNHIDLYKYQEADYDEVGCGIGLAFSRPGGLRENVELRTPDAWIRQIEGPERVYKYLDEYSKRMIEHQPLPLIVDILNCQSGCNNGTGTCGKISVDDIDDKMNALIKEKIQTYHKRNQGSGILSEYELFYKDLRLSDFGRLYEDKSGVLGNHEISDLEQIFTQLHKTTEASRNVNCYACGFGNCQEFAKSVLQGTNHISNCIDYNRKELVREKEHLSQRNKEIKQLHYLATHDFLTDIPNRYYLEEYLNKLMLSNTGKRMESALLFIDLDNFKVVNDSFGHASGDQILLSVIKQLDMHLGDTAFLARLGGDEFAVVLKDTSLEKASSVANQLLQALRMEDFKVEGHQVTIKLTASIGIMIIDGTLDTQTLFSYADVALYTAKEEGKNRISSIQSSYDSARLLKSNRTILLINNALKEDRFTLYFQPVVKMDGSIVHYEALLRMLDQQGDLIFPNEFLPIAERFGLMSQIDRWVVNSAIEFLTKHTELSLFVNLSASSFADEELLKFIELRITESSVLPSRIGFEITETAAIKDLDQAEHWIRRLKLTGCKFALDDFGVGFLTFTHLQRLPVDYLKIDGSFIRNLDVDPINKALVQAINAVAHALSKATIAEYVENEEIWRILGDLKIDFGQGYFLGRPATLKDLPIDVVTKYKDLDVDASIP